MSFALDTPVVLRIKLDATMVSETHFYNYASASVSAFQALISGALSVEILPARGAF